MRFRRFPSFILLALFASVCAAQTQPPPVKRDVQAIAVLQQALAAMGGAVPSDITAIGKITIVEGSSVESGTIRVLSRGADKTLEQISTDHSQRESAFSNWRAHHKRGTDVQSLPFERGFEHRTVLLPVVLIGSAVSDSDLSLEYVGIEKLGTMDVHHIRIWKVFSTAPKLQHISEYSRHSLYIDARTLLVKKFAYTVGGSDYELPKVRVEATYAEYRNVGGLATACHIEKFVQGVKWATIEIDSVAINAGLNETLFQVSSRRPQ